jgi:hypothetical protein
MRSMISCGVLVAMIGCRSGVDAERSGDQASPTPTSTVEEASVERAPPPASDPASADTPPVAEPPAPIEDRQFDWSVPPCPLTYHYRARLGAGLSEMIIEFDLVMSARDVGVSLHAGELRVSQTLDGKPFGEGLVEAEGSLADVHLELADGIWKEVDGTTKLWSALDSAPSLLFMWPALPARRDAGATASWTIAGHHDSPEVARTEAARGSLELPEDWEPFEYEAPDAGVNTVTLEAWDGSGAANKAILVVDEEHSFAIPGESDEGKMRQVGRYEVLDNGRLVAADVTIELEMGRTTVSQRAELSLTDACDMSPVKSRP